LLLTCLIFIITLVEYRVFVGDQFDCILGTSFMFVLKSWYSSVSIVAILLAGRSRAQFLAVTVIFIFFRISPLFLGLSQPPIQNVLRAAPPLLTDEADSLLLSTAKDKNVWSCTSAAVYALLAWTETAVPSAFTM
jgi:hypothetical protein